MATLLIKHGADPWAVTSDTTGKYDLATGRAASRNNYTHYRYRGRGGRGRWYVRHPRVADHSEVAKIPTNPPFFSKRRVGNRRRASFNVEYATGMHHMALCGFSTAIQSCIDQKIPIPPDALISTVPHKVHSDSPPSFDYCLIFIILV